MVYVPTDLYIYDVVSADPGTNLLGTFSSMDANM